MLEEDKEELPTIVCVTVGMFQENCYLYACPETLETVIIDPGDEAERIHSEYPGV
jgi:glyoxylase-like metal-dependent hydrolase (beta-lactamase superfamily II)